jgi:hypothetical protein
MTFGESKGILAPATPEEGRSSMDEAPKTLTVPAAGKRYFGLAKNASYAAAARGEIPVIRIGARLRVPVVALERMLTEAGTGRAA